MVFHDGVIEAVEFTVEIRHGRDADDPQERRAFVGDRDCLIEHVQLPDDAVDADGVDAQIFATEGS